MLIQINKQMKLMGIKRTLEKSHKNKAMEWKISSISPEELKLRAERPIIIAVARIKRLSKIIFL